MNDDIGDTLAPKSEQLDAIELIDGPRIFTVKSVSVNKDAEQPVRIYFEEFPRPWRPGVNQRRVLKHCWGRKSSTWTGRKMKLFYDPEVIYGKSKPGGTRISHLSHIDGPMDAPVLLSQGRPDTYHVEPLIETAPATTDQLVRLGRLLKSLSLTDPTEALDLMGTWIGRTIASTKELSVDECDTVLGCLRELEREAEALADADDAQRLIPEGEGR